MTHPAGTRILADCALHTVEGTLLADVESFDDVFRVRCDDDGEILSLNGWLWSVEVVEPDPCPMPQTVGFYAGQAIAGVLTLGGMLCVAALPHLLFWS